MAESSLSLLADALADAIPSDWHIDGPHNGKLIVLRHRSNVAIQIDRGQRQHGACRLFAETEILHSGSGPGGYRTSRAQVVRTWTAFGHLPMPTQLPTETDALRNALVAAIDRALGPTAELRLKMIRARLALDIAPFRDGRPDPQGIGWFLAAETHEIYGPRQTLKIDDGPAYQALLQAMENLCVLQHGKIIPIPQIHIPETDSAHARAEAAELLQGSPLEAPLTLSLA